MLIANTQRNVRLNAAIETFQTRATGILSAVKMAKVRRARFNRTYLELSALSDRELADLAIPRSQIRHIAQQEAKKVVVNDAA